MIYPLQQLLHLYQIHILRIIVYSDILPVHTLPLYPINTFPVPCRSTIQYLMYQQMRFLRCMYFLPCTSPIYALKTDFPACLRLSPYILSVLLKSLFWLLLPEPPLLKRSTSLSNINLYKTSCGFKFIFFAMFLTAPFICSALFIVIPPCIFLILQLYEMPFHTSSIFVCSFPDS